MGVFAVATPPALRATSPASGEDKGGSWRSINS
jgi:hypothetical protein